MGSSSWSDDFYEDRATDRKSKGTDAFEYDRVVKTTKYEDQKVHDDLNPKNVIRESRDSKEHPESNAIAVMFDVTGSMYDIPKQMNLKLPELMGLLLRKGYVAHPQILFGCIGDEYSDRGSLQVGQFESGIEMDDDFTKFWLEGGGGGSYEESYQNAMYFFAHKTQLDCFEKRGKKGYLFMIGDEHCYPKVNREKLEAIIGDTIQESIPTEQVVADLQKTYNVFHVIPTHTVHGKDSELKSYWRKLLGEQNVFILEDPNNICELIGSTIGVMEGSMDFDRIGEELDHVDKAVIADVSKALDPLAKSLALAKTGTGSLPSTEGRSATTERL